jgi:MtN3 and saliva related transmembrane protein
LSIEWLGYIAALITTMSFVPQIVRVFRLKSAREISLPFTVLMLIGVIGWLIYGIVLGRPSIIAANIVGGSLTALLLVGKLKYGKS